MRCATGETGTFARYTPARLSDFERGTDPRGAISIPASLAFSGPLYAWESPPSVQDDDINYWDVTADGDSSDEYVDYVFKVSNQDWRTFDTLRLKLSTTCSGTCSGSKVRVFIHDADGTGNNQGNGYHSLGDLNAPNGTIDLNISGATNRDKIDQVLIRVYESFFGGVGHAGAYQRTHLYSLDLGQSATSIGARWTRTTFDALGRALLVTQPDGTTTSTSYSLGSLGSLATNLDANDHKTTQENDVFGRLRTVREYRGSSSYTLDATTSYSYDSRDLLTTITAEGGYQTSLFYDSVQRKTEIRDPDLGTWYYAYDPSGSLIRQQDAKGQRTCLYYDARNRPTGKHYRNDNNCPASPTTGQLAVRYGYEEANVNGLTIANGQGQRTSLTAGNNVTAWSYTNRGQQATSKTTVGGGTAYQFSWAYDAADRLVAVTYPEMGGGAGAETVKTSYDAAWRPLSLCVDGGGCYVQSASYTALDVPDAWTFGNGAVQDWLYSSPMARLERLKIGASGCTSTCLFDRSYLYDSIGNILTLTDHKTPTTTHRYTYDARNRLTCWKLNTNPSTCSGTGTTAYSYDALGNLQSKGTRDYDYGHGNHIHAVSFDDVTNYTYDLNGNLSSGGNRTFGWDAENRPTSIASGGVTETYSYDGDGERASKTRAGVTTSYYHGLLERAGSTWRRHYHFNGNVVAQRDASSLVYLAGDHLGSVSLSMPSTSISGQVQEFDPWGAVRSGAISSTELNYTGQRRDDTGLLYFHARYYDPDLGRFISPDTIVPGAGALTVAPNDTVAASVWGQRGGGPANPQDLNRYSYGGNNPIRNTDPTGHWVESAVDVAFIAYDLYDISQNGLNLVNGLSLAADVAGLILPIVTGGGAAVRAIAHADNATEAIKAADGGSILFGQARIDPTFSTKPGVPKDLRGRSLEEVAGELASGKRSPDSIRIEAFAHEGQLIATNNRGLAALSMAGQKPTNVVVRQPTRSELKRLNELSVLGDPLPARRIAITSSRNDATIIRTVYLPE